jgi:hypothetical protein
MSARAKCAGAIVSRRYRASPYACACAVEILLKHPGTTKAAELVAELVAEPDGRDDAAEVRHKEEVSHIAQLND